MSMTEPQRANLDDLIARALTEDLGDLGDVTSRATIPASQSGRAAFVARGGGVLAGLEAIERVCRRVDPAIGVTASRGDGDRLAPGERFATVAGPMRSILSAERTALNFLQHLSGVATMAARYREAVTGLPVQILDTRKTLPGWRLLDKYAVACGGGTNHRVGLHDMFLIKDNHLAAVRAELGSSGSAVVEAVARCRAMGANLPVEVEVDTLEQLSAALSCRPDFVLLDNMSVERLREAVRMRNETAPGVQLEASGGVNLTTVRAIAETGVDRISVGAITHSAPALDIALDYLDA